MFKSHSEQVNAALMTKMMKMKELTVRMNLTERHVNTLLHADQGQQPRSLSVFSILNRSKRKFGVKGT